LQWIQGNGRLDLEEKDPEYSSEVINYALYVLKRNGLKLIKGEFFFIKMPYPQNLEKI